MWLHLKLKWTSTALLDLTVLMKVILKHIYCSHVQTYICVYVWRILVVFLSLPAAVTFDLWIRYRKETKKKQPKDSTSK